MENTAFYRWGVRHKLLTRLLMNLFFCSAYTALLCRINVPWPVIVLVDLFWILLNQVYLDSLQQRRIQKVLTKLHDDCDPEPLLEETREQLTFQNSDVARQALLINHCAALQELGQLEQALELMQSIHIDQYAGTLPANKAVYYHNLSDLCELQGDTAAADIWYEKMMQIYNDLPDNRQKKALAPTIPGINAAFHLRNGRLDQAMTWAKQMPRDNRHQTVHYALTYGQIAIGQGDFENAKKALTYTETYGNRLYAVTFARKLLKELQETAPEV